MSRHLVDVAHRAEMAVAFRKKHPLSDQGQQFLNACLAMNTLKEMEAACAQHTADKTDCKHWGISAAEWHDVVHMALAQKRGGAK